MFLVVVSLCAMHPLQRFLASAILCMIERSTDTMHIFACACSFPDRELATVLDRYPETGSITCLGCGVRSSRGHCVLELLSLYAAANNSLICIGFEFRARIAIGVNVPSIAQLVSRSLLRLIPRAQQLCAAQA